MAALAAAGVAVETLMVMDGAPDWYHPGRSGTLRLGPKTVLAVFGELHPRSLQAMDIKGPLVGRSEEHTSELQSLMRISYAVFCLKKQTTPQHTATPQTSHSKI